LFQRRYRPFLMLAAVGVAVGAYGLYWSSQLDEFKAAITALAGPSAPVVLSGAELDYGGFPYRLSVTVRDATLTRTRGDYEVALRAPQLVIERQPWKPDLTLGLLDKPSISVRAPDVMGGVAVTATGDNGRFSLKLNPRGVERLSVVFEEARVSGAPWFDKPLRASQFEVHGREVAALRRAPVPAGGNSPTGEAVLELFINGEAVRLGAGDPLALTGNLGVTAIGPAEALTSLAAWRSAGGTVELYGLTLSDKVEPVVMTKGSFALQADGALLASGTLNSPCPDAVLAGFGMAPSAADAASSQSADAASSQSADAASSQSADAARSQSADAANDAPAAPARYRQPVALSFRNQIDGFKLVRQSPEMDLPARNRAAPCPVLRR
jgi:hypothetical protein